jgi:hypothetical protein
MRDDHDTDLLKNEGAAEVIPDVFEVSLSLASQTFNYLGLPKDQIVRLIQTQRSSQYSNLKEHTHD